MPAQRTKHPTAVRSAIYLRVSLDQTGEGLAVERQREDCERIVRERGWTITETYVDNSVSAFSKTTARPAYERMTADYLSGRFDALVCWDLDRLTRQPRQLEDWIDYAEERGLRLVTANGEADLGTDGGRMYARIKAAVARAEGERKGARQSRAQQQRAAMGRPPRGIRATGYTLDGEVIAEEAEAVRAVYAAFTSGSSLKAIASALSGVEPVLRTVGGVPMQQQDVPKSVPVLPTRSGRPWNATSVHSLLRNPRYAGWSMLSGKIVRDGSGEPVRGQWEPLVDDALWLEVQRRLDDPTRKSNRVGTERKHLGSGLFVCDVCDERVRSHNTRYRCAGHVMRARDQIDGLVLRMVHGRLSKQDFPEHLPGQADGRVEELRQHEQKHRDRIARARADYEDELIEADLYRGIRDRAEAAIAALQSERLALTAGSVAVVVLGAESPAEAFESAGLAVQRAVIDALAQVRLMPAPRGRKALDPETVIFNWRA
ncbi:recombinase family protein [Skermania sp. ID1734]|uniref:recombinase family protein n=1 Tax=Skermania sp. ID1734 TaxID=2597516 RepID=UPI00117CB708|nr:recombinase family protein [Skermania sp. ID1734]TSE01961.1 recombinase family protein [Skermania sp. ID1734]